MGISFKVSRFGTRACAKPLQQEVSVQDTAENFNSMETAVTVRVNDSSSANIARKPKVDIIDVVDDVAGNSTSSISSGTLLNPVGAEVSFTLNLFPDGYFIKKPSEIEAHPIPLQDASILLRPYDRLSESLFSAIECGHLPGNILNEIPCKYVDGALVCEVRDYRNCVAESSFDTRSTSELPIVNKVCLRMSLENIVKDIPLISDGTWTYGDLMEVESRILNALQPKLCLDPVPKLDRLFDNPNPAKLNLDYSSLRRKRLRQMAEVTVTSCKTIQGKKVCIDRVTENSSSLPIPRGQIPHDVLENIIPESIIPSSLSATRQRSLGLDAPVPSITSISNQPRFQLAASGSQRILADHGGVSPASLDPTSSYTENVNTNGSLIHGKKDNHEGMPTKRARLTPAEQLVSHVDGPNASDFNWKNANVCQPSITSGLQYINPGQQKYSPQGLGGFFNQEARSGLNSIGQPGLRFNTKEDAMDIGKSDRPDLNRGKSNLQMLETESNQNRMQSKLPPQKAFVRSNFSSISWNNLAQPIEKDLSWREEQIQRRKSVPSPRVSAATSVPSPLSSKSGEFSSGSFGHQFGAITTNAALGSSHKEKASVTSVYGGTPSLSSTVNDPMQRQHQAQNAAKRRSFSLPKSPAPCGVASPVSVGNASVPLSSNSPPVGTPPFSDQSLLERFYKIKDVAMRHNLHRKKIVENYPIRKPNTYSPHELKHCLSLASIVEDIKDETSTRPLSRSLVGGSVNNCKMRVLSLVLKEEIFQGNQVTLIEKARTKLIMAEKPNNGTIALHYGETEEGDILGAFLAAEEYLPTLPNTHLADLLATQLRSLMLHDGYVVETDMVQPKPQPRTIHPSSNPSPFPPNNSLLQMQQQQQQYQDSVSGQAFNEMARVRGSGVLANARTLPSCSNPQPAPARSHPLDALHPQFHRNPLLLSSSSFLNPIGSAQSMPIGSGFGPGSGLYKPGYLLQQQQQPPQQQQQQMQRNLMGLGPGVNMGNMSNSMVGLSGLGLGGGRGMGQASSLNAISQQLRLRSSPFPQAQSVLGPRLRMAHDQTGPRQINPSSMIGQLTHSSTSGISVVNRGGSMGPPKVGPAMANGMNMYLNQQLQQHFQQEMGSPSGQQMMSQQLAGQQMMSQQGSPQMSSGLVRALSSGNQEGCAASPQLSSQTLGSVGNMANSPMEMQGVNSNNS